MKTFTQYLTEAKKYGKALSQDEAARMKEIYRNIVRTFTSTRWPVQDDLSNKERNQIKRVVSFFMKAQFGERVGIHNKVGVLTQKIFDTDIAEWVVAVVTREFKKGDYELLFRPGAEDRRGPTDIFGFGLTASKYKNIK